MGIKEEIYRSMDIGMPIKKYINTDIVTEKVAPVLDRNIIGLGRFYENIQKCCDSKKNPVSATSNIRLSDSTITLRNKIMGAFE